MREFLSSKLGPLFLKYRQQWTYLVVGVCTTVINYVVYGLLTYGTQIHYIVGNIIAWVCAVAFSYFANGKWVYRPAGGRSLGEAGAFVASRLFSLGLETALLFMMVDLASLGEMVAKLIVAVVVVVVNYLTGLLVYREKKRG